MLPKKFRLKFVEFYRNPNKRRRFSTPVLDLFFKVSDNVFPRFVIVVAKSLDKRSSRRHKTRRMIVEVIRKHLPEVEGGGDVLIRAKKIFEEKDLLLFEKEISRGLQGMGLIRAVKTKSSVIKSGNLK